MGAKIVQGGDRSRRAHRVMSEINVTPFVDVMLVLLVIFMVTAPLLTAGVTVDLPDASASAISRQDNTPLEVSMDGKGNLFLGDTKVTQEQLDAKLRAIAAEAPDRRIYIRADRALDYGRVVSIMSAVNAAGFSKIALVTDPASTGKK